MGKEDCALKHVYSREGFANAGAIGGGGGGGGHGSSGLREKLVVWAGLPRPPLLALNHPCSLSLLWTARKAGGGALSLQTTAWDLVSYFPLCPQPSARDPRKLLLNYGTLGRGVLESVYSVFPQSVSNITLGMGSVKATTTPTKYIKGLIKVPFGGQQCILTY